MRYILKITFTVFIVVQSVGLNAQSYSLCGKTGNCTMTWEEFSACKKELVTTDKNISISSFRLTVQKAKKKEFVFLEFPQKGNGFSKASLDMIEALHKDKKLGSKLEVDAVEVVQSGKAARKLPGMVITLNLE